MKTVASAIGVGIAALLILAGCVAAQGAIVMLVLAGLHNFVSEQVPAVGFVGSTMIGLGLSVLGSFFKGSRS